MHCRIKKHCAMQNSIANQPAMRHRIKHIRRCDVASKKQSAMRHRIKWKTGLKGKETDKFKNRFSGRTKTPSSPEGI